LPVKLKATKALAALPPMLLAQTRRSTKGFLLRCMSPQLALCVGSLRRSIPSAIGGEAEQFGTRPK